MIRASSEDEMGLRNKIYDLIVNGKIINGISKKVYIIMKVKILYFLLIYRFIWNRSCCLYKEENIFINIV